MPTKWCCTSNANLSNKLKTKWNSFKDFLLLDSAIPFHIPHQDQAPELLTRASAMNAGWMWQIPLVNRIGAGYVFSSQHINEEQAIDEIQQYLGFKIEPHKTLKFEPGHFEQVWQKNVMALGLASGFVEPLEATSIGQMLEQLRMFTNVLVNSGLVVSDLSIQQFNQANAASWQVYVISYVCIMIVSEQIPHFGNKSVKRHILKVIRH